MLPTCCRNAMRLKPIGKRKLLLRCYSTAPGPSPSILFFGTDRFSIECLDRLNMARETEPGLFRHIEVVTKPPSLEGRGKKAQKSKSIPLLSMRELNIVATHIYADKHGIPVHNVTKESIKEFDPTNTTHPFDLVIAASFGLFIPTHILEGRSTINVHPSLLPQYRGPAPIEHAILNGDRHSGISLQTISTQGFDKGIVFAQSLPIPIDETERLASLRYRLGVSASKMLLKCIMGRTYLDPQPVKTFTEESYAPLVHIQIDWTAMSAEHIVRVGRLFEPTAFLISKDDGRLVSCHLSGISHRQQEGGKHRPGDFFLAREARFGQKKMVVVCADGKTVFVEDIKVSGRNWITGLNFTTTSDERFWGGKFVPWRREFEDHDPKEFE